MHLTITVNVPGLEEPQRALLMLGEAHSTGQQECTQRVIAGPGCESTKGEVQSGNSGMRFKYGLPCLMLAVTLSWRCACLSFLICC